MTSLAQKKAEFEKNKIEIENALLEFKGLSREFDIYNCSVPFTWQGRRYIYGRVEKRHEWARSHVRLFAETGKDEFTLIPNSMIYQLEDPFITFINNEIILGGTHVVYSRGKIKTYYGYFYRGTDLEDLCYFTTGPDYMKDIRLVQLQNGIGVFSRPRNAEVEKQYGSGSVIGFTVIPDLDSLDETVITNAKVIPGLFGKDEWGGCNQCHLLDSGLIGVIGHKSYKSEDNLTVYVNTSFVFDPVRHIVLDEKIIAVRSSYPSFPEKKPDLVDCAFTSGIVMRKDGNADLYSGLGDTAEGRVVISYPFSGYGKLSAITRN